MSMKERTAIVTGASSGIGRAIAERLGAAGATVYLAGRTPEPLAASVEQIRAAGGKAVDVLLDVRDTGALRALIERAASETGRLDIMVNNAGGGRLGHVLSGDEQDWKTMLEVNVLAVAVGCQAAVATMQRLGQGGHIINVSSTGADETHSGMYGATKSAVNHLTRSLRAELEETDIRVTAVMPGIVATNFVRHLDPAVVKAVAAMAGVELDPAAGERLPDEVLRHAQSILEPFMAKPEDVADAVYYIVTLPLRLNVPEIVVRPARTMQLF